MPSTLFEVEHSTDIQNSLLKFVELQDFNANFFIVADKARKTEYAGKLALNAFVPIKARVQFMDSEFKRKHIKEQGFKLIDKGNFEMIEYKDPNADVLIYFSNPTLAEVLRIV